MKRKKKVYYDENSDEWTVTVGTKQFVGNSPAMARHMVYVMDDLLFAHEEIRRLNGVIKGFCRPADIGEVIE